VFFFWKQRADDIWKKEREKMEEFFLIFDWKRIGGDFFWGVGGTGRGKGGFFWRVLEVLG
jgi:hypothetical protein